MQLVGNNNRGAAFSERNTRTCCSCQVNSDHQVVEDSPGNHHASPSHRSLTVAIESAPASGMDTGPKPVPMCNPVQRACTLWGLCFALELALTCQNLTWKLKNTSLQQLIASGFRQTEPKLYITVASHINQVVDVSVKVTSLVLPKAAI